MNRWWPSQATGGKAKAATVNAAREWAGEGTSTGRYLSKERMGWTEGFEPSISRATTWRLNRSATPTRIKMPCGLDSPPMDRRRTPAGAAWRPLRLCLSLA